MTKPLPFRSGEPLKSSIATYRPEFSGAFFAPRYWLTWLLIGLMRVAAALPLAVAHLPGAALGMLFYLLNAKRRRIARINVDLCFPELAPGQRARLVRDHYLASGKSIINLAVYWWSSERRLQRLTTVTGFEHFAEQIRQGRKVIVLTGHFVGVDLAGIFLSRYHPMIAMMKATRNPVLNWYLWKGRTRFGGVMTLREQGLRPIVRGLKERRFTYYIPDEDFGNAQSVFAPFMGVPTSTLTTLGRLARATDAVVIPAFSRTLPRGRGFEVIVQPPLKNFPGGDPVQDARQMNQALEEGVRMMPEQYMWTLKWFKTRPAGEPSPYKQNRPS
jgi:lipid A biosynthesis lauroyl/palmitoleoyl acyltransferase